MIPKIIDGDIDESSDIILELFKEESTINNMLLKEFYQGDPDY
jgi:hypothetical protein